MQVDKIRAAIRTIPDFPKPGILFRDITTLLENAEAFSLCVDAMADKVKGETFSKIVGIESRGFIFGAALAIKFRKPLVLARKSGKLPGKTISMTYDLEYGKDTLNIHETALQKGDQCLVVDDLLATGGTAGACCKLLESVGCKVTSCLFAIALPDLKGQDVLKQYNPQWVVSFEGH